MICYTTASSTEPHEECCKHGTSGECLCRRSFGFAPKTLTNCWCLHVHIVRNSQMEHEGVILPSYPDATANWWLKAAISELLRVASYSNEATRRSCFVWVFVLHQKPHRKNDKWSSENFHQLIEPSDRNCDKKSLYLCPLWKEKFYWFMCSLMRVGAEFLREEMPTSNSYNIWFDRFLVVSNTSKSLMDAGLSFSSLHQCGKVFPEINISRKSPQHRGWNSLSCAQPRTRSFRFGDGTKASISAKDEVDWRDYRVYQAVSSLYYKKTIKLRAMCVVLL